jgi:hypothetical protein
MFSRRIVSSSSSPKSIFLSSYQHPNHLVGVVTTTTKWFSSTPSISTGADLKSVLAEVTPKEQARFKTLKEKVRDSTLNNKF